MIMLCQLFTTMLAIMTNAAASVSWENTPCVAHTLQLAVMKGLEVNEISRLTAVCRKLVGHFKHSIRAA